VAASLNPWIYKSQYMRIKEEFRKLIPPLSKEEFEQLEQNCIKEGIRDAIVVWREFIIDGHNRYEIAQAYSLPFQVNEKHFENEDEVKEWMIVNQFGRRNLSNYQRSVLALELEGIFKEKAAQKKIESGGSVPQKSAKPPIDTRNELAKAAKVSHDTIAKVKTIQAKAPEETKRKLETGEVSINQVYNEIKAEEKKEERKQYIEKQKQDIEQGVIELPKGKYEVIAVDPPWNYGREYDPNGSRVANPYPEMTQNQLKEIELPSTEDAVLFLWTTHQFIFDAKELLEHWGFTYKATMVWDKEKIGMGAWLRMQCEFCLVGIKGKPIWNNTTWRDIIREPRREHSRKPDAFYSMVEDVTVGRRLEYFSREQREKWSTYGNETGKF
jgi:N6-adenosine-specific RNA methylase IME4